MENKKFKAMKFCWICSKRFYGNMKYLIKGEDGEEHLVHKTCANDNNYWIITGYRGHECLIRNIRK